MADTSMIAFAVGPDRRPVTEIEFRQILANGYDIEALRDAAGSLLDGQIKMARQLAEERALNDRWEKEVQAWARQVQAEFKRQLEVRQTSTPMQAPPPITFQVEPGAFQISLQAPAAAPPPVDVEVVRQ